MKKNKTTRGNLADFIETTHEYNKLDASEIKNKKAEKLFRILFNNSPIGIYILLDGRFQFVNPQFQSMTGWIRDELIGIVNPLRIVHPQDRQSVRENTVKMLKGERTSPFEFRRINRSGETRWSMGTVTSIQKDRRNLIMGTILDITDLKKAEVELRESEERYRGLVELSPDAIAVHCDGRIVFINKSGTERLGAVKQEEVIGRPLLDFVHPDCHGIVIQRVHEMLNKREPVPLIEEKFVKLDGTVIDVEVAAAPLTFKGKPSVLVVVRDISQQKRAMEELNRLNQFLSIIIDNANVWLKVLDENTNVVIWNKAAEIISGYSGEEVIGHNKIWEWLYPDEEYREQIAGKAMEIIRKGEITEDFETEIMTKNKEKKIISWHSKNLFDERGAVLGSVALGRDVTESRLTEKALQDSKERYRILVEHSRDAIFVFTKERRYIDANPAACSMLGYSRADLLQMEIEDLLAPELMDPGLKLFETLVLQGYVFGEITLKDRFGRYIPGEINATVLPDGNYLGTVRDITERKHLERKMARLDQLNLVGQMAAAIGHEIRNPMTAVRGFLQMMVSKKEYSRDRQYFDLMIEELDRANSIITEFLSVAKNKPVVLEKKNLKNIVQSLSQLIAADALNSNKNLDLELGEVPDLPLDEKEIRQLVLNLVRNGFEAMSSGGVVTIKTYEDGDEVILSVQDQGKGIDKGILDKIGTPFLTTKDTGTGLGLAVCYGIAARHNATIDLNTGNTGTTFFIRFKQKN
ncbi:MAG: PAS domain S-box protein [Bacillota bacterium]